MDNTVDVLSKDSDPTQLLHAVRSLANPVKNLKEDQVAAFKTIKSKKNVQTAKREMEDLRAKNEELAESNCKCNEKIAKLVSENARPRVHNDSTTRRNNIDSVARESTDVLGLIGCMYGWRNLCCSCIGQPCVLLVSSLEVLSRADPSSKTGEANQVFYELLKCLGIQ